MSKYTTEVRYICETYAGLTESLGYSSIDEIISKARSKVFDFTYPLFDENYRGVLENKILLHFYTREIGLETVGLWKLKLKTKLNEIMPYYNQLYQSELLEFNPLYDVDYTRTGNKHGEGTDNGSGESTNTKTNTGTQTMSISNDVTESPNQWTEHSDTPQGGINGLADSKYLTDATRVSGTNVTNTAGSNQRTDDLTQVDRLTSSNSGSSTSMEEYTETVKGKMGGGSYVDALMKFRESFLNIDMLIINELNELFMNIF